MTPNLLAVMPTPLMIVKEIKTPSSADRNIVIRALMCAYAIKYGTKPEYIMAVAHIESRKGNVEFRTNKTGRYYQPMGIHECFLRERGWPVNTLDGNIEVGARALRGIQSEDRLKSRLKKYNATFNQSYWKEVVKAADKYRKKGVAG